MSEFELKETRRNHGNREGVILKLVSKQDFVITIKDIVKMILIDSINSDTMAKLINVLGLVNKQYQSTTCWSVDDLNEDGKQFILDMAYFIKDNKDG